MPNRTLTSVAAFLMINSTAMVATTDGWRLFRSDNGFTVRYPSHWIRFETSEDYLQLKSSKGGAEGVIIKPGQALLTVTEADSSSGKPLPQVIRYYTKETTVLSERALPSDTSPQACHSLTEVVSREPLVPLEDVPKDMVGKVPYMINTELFCVLGSRTMATLLRNYESDKQQAIYQGIALRMAKSIRSVSVR